MYNIHVHLTVFCLRLSVQLYGFELHVYNRSHLYKDLEEKFGLEPGILPRQESTVVQVCDNVTRGSNIKNLNCDENGTMRR